MTVAGVPPAHRTAIHDRRQLAHWQGRCSRQGPNSPSFPCDKPDPFPRISGTSAVHAGNSQACMLRAHGPSHRTAPSREAGCASRRCFQWSIFPDERRVPLPRFLPAGRTRPIPLDEAHYIRRRDDIVPPDRQAYSCGHVPYGCALTGRETSRAHNILACPTRCQP